MDGVLWKNAVLLGFLALSMKASAHEHQTEDIPENEYVSNDPLDSILKAHIALMTISFGILYPTGMVLGLSKNRFHVPVQIFASVLAIVGYFLGHHHKGRQFKENIHANFVPYFLGVLFLQLILGVILKLHIERPPLGRIRPILVKSHLILGILIPILSWIQMGFGAIAGLGFCREDHLGQCLAHGIMGSAFVAYGLVLIIMMQLGQAWLKRSGRGQEFFDSTVITLWGIVNTFTEHRWGQDWNHGDYQHTSMGIVWWAAGMVGIFLSSRSGRPKRNHIPALVIILTGYAMSVHTQHLEISTKVHAVFGYTLMAAGLSRIIEVSFVLHDKPSPSFDDIHSFQYLAPYFLVASGYLFMGANEEQLQLLHAMGIDHASWVLVLYSFAFITYFFFLFLIWLYMKNRDGSNVKNSNYHSLNGFGARDNEAQQAQAVHDAEEFELGPIISSDEEDRRPNGH